MHNIPKSQKLINLIINMQVNSKSLQSIKKHLKNIFPHKYNQFNK